MLFALPCGLITNLPPQLPRRILRFDSADYFKNKQLKNKPRGSQRTNDATDLFGAGGMFNVRVSNRFKINVSGQERIDALELWSFCSIHSLITSHSALQGEGDSPDTDPFATAKTDTTPTSMLRKKQKKKGVGPK